MQGFKKWIKENSYFEGKEIDNFKFKNNYDLAEKYAEKQLALYIVSQQRELLKGFVDWFNKTDKTQAIINERLEEYLKTL